MTRVERLMGTVFTIRILDEGADPEIVDRAFAWLHRVEAFFSTFRDDSEISRIGRGDLSVDDASADVRHVLSVCADLEAATEGRFSIRPGRPGGPGLDPAGYVKGWAVDEAAMGLKLDGATRFVIDAGGDVLVSGAAPAANAWRVGVRHPLHPEEIGAVLLVREGAVATSGSYFRGEHVWGDPQAGRDILSATVVGPKLGIADALATALYGDRASSLAWLASFPDYGVAFIDGAGTLSWTPQLDGKVEGAAPGARTDA
jgi:thiamine biosynthesis lipoprotein